MDTTIETTTPQGALTEIRKLRLANKNQWMFLTVKIGDAVFLIKTFNLTIQKITCGDINHATGDDLSAKKFDALLIAAFTY